MPRPKKKLSNLDQEISIAEASYQKGIEDPVVWTLRNIKLPKDRKWDMNENLWQVKILEDPSREIAVKKSVQRGLTTTFLSKILHYINYHSSTVMYTLPRRDDITDFVGNTLNPIIQRSPHLQAIVADVDSVRLKRFRAGGIDSYFHLMEGSVEPRMIPVDILVNDEVDRSDPNYLQIFRGRLEASHDPHHFMFSTPTLPGYGIDKLYEDTTQNEWFVKCQACQERQFLSWDIHFQETPEPHYACQHCHAKLTIEAIIGGEWQPLFPSRSVQGYHVTHMMCPISRPPAELFTELTSGKTSKKNFYNLILGQAYSSATGRLTKEVVRQRMFDSPHPFEPFPATDQSYFMGVDQGNDIHLTIFRRDGRLRRIVYAKKIPYKSSRDWYQEVIDLIRTWHVRFCVLDALPNTHDARKVLEEFQSEDRVALCQYSEIEEPLKRDRLEGKVHLSKTEAFDGLVAEITDGAWKIWGIYEGEQVTKTMVNHITSLMRDEREDSMGRIRGFWLPMGPDHFFHSILYARTAMVLSGGSDFKVVSVGQAVDNIPDNAPQKQTGLYKVWGIVPMSPDETPGDVEIPLERLIFQ